MKEINMTVAIDMIWEEYYKRNSLNWAWCDKGSLRIKPAEIKELMKLAWRKGRESLKEKLSGEKNV